MGRHDSSLVPCCGIVTFCKINGIRQSPSRRFNGGGNCCRGDGQKKEIGTGEGKGPDFLSEPASPFSRKQEQGTVPLTWRPSPV